MSAGGKVLSNTLILYARMVITLGISLYSTRILLEGLGVVDFGIFNLLSGIVVLLAFLNNGLATSTQRFLSIYQGKNDLEKQKNIFRNSVILHFIIGIIVVLILVLFSNFFFNRILNIPVTRIEASWIVFQFMIASIFFTIISVPFNGSLIAHENMLWTAIINSFEAVFKLIFAVLILKFQGDRLIFYGACMAGLSLFSSGMFMFYCFKHYPECTLKGEGKIERNLIKQLISFAGWNLVGALCSVARIQGLSVILNVFVGATINAAYGIASQLSSQMIFISSTLLRALNPQIMKSEGGGDRERMLRLALIGSKFSFYLLSLIAVPLIFEMKFVLSIWLKEVPLNSVIFCQLILVGLLISQLSVGLQSAMQAEGNIKIYQIVVGGTILLNLPLAYFLLYKGLPPYSVLISYILIEFVAFCLRVYISWLRLGVKPVYYFNEVIYKAVIPVLISSLICFCAVKIMDTYFRLVSTFLFSNLVLIFIAWKYFVSSTEKRHLIDFFKKIITKFNSSLA